MSGTKAGWTPERRAARAEHMRRLNADPEINQRRLSGIRIFNASAGKRKSASESLKRLHGQEDFQERHRVRNREIAQRPDVIAKVVATRKAGKVPEGHGKRYRQLRDMIGPAAAMGIVHREAEMEIMNHSRRFDGAH